MSGFDIRRFMDRAEFMADANCLGLDPTLFFPHQGEFAQAVKAKAICNACDVQAECLAYALNNGENHGIWGGMSERERRRIRRGRATNTTGPIPPPTTLSPSTTAPSPATASTATAAPNHASGVPMLTLSTPNSPAHLVLLRP